MSLAVSSKLPHSLGGGNRPRRLPRHDRLDFQNVPSATGPPGGPMGHTTLVGHPGLPEYHTAMGIPRRHIHNSSPRSAPRILVRVEDSVLTIWLNIRRLCVRRIL